MKHSISASRLANLGSNAILRGFDRFTTRFCAVTERARSRFEHRDWEGVQRDARERLEVYSEALGHVEAEIHELLGDRIEDKLIWTSIKAVFSGQIAERDDWELAETFFNSVTRRVFTTVGVNPLVEFVSSDFAKPPTRPHERVYSFYDRAGTTAQLVESVLTDFRFRSLYEDIRRDARLVAAEVDAHLNAIGHSRAFEKAEILRPVFYRGMGAYIVGRLRSGEVVIPLVLALRHSPDGVAVDAVLLDVDDVSILFSFTWSHFHVSVARPYDLVDFLHTLMPRKRRAELYTSIGYIKHGKTELYRDLLDHLATSEARFERAPGDAGLVMSVFTMPGFEMVFKILRDSFGAPKQITRRSVRDKYRLVFRHDRVGRLIEAHEFEHLELERRHFAAELLADLEQSCSRLVQVDGDRIVITHAYIERRVVPLNLHLRADPDDAPRALIDYGNAIRDLAVSNIFPGDMLLKNFGVTRHGRVVFYDYDELTELLECEFKTMPQPSSYDDEFAAEPWYGVGDNDIFPEEFRSFLGLPKPLRAVFEEHHSDLFTPAYWQGVQKRLAAGEIIEIFPYGERRRLRNI